MSRLVVCALGSFAVVVPAASADTTDPVWTCRASAAYVESPLLDPLLGTRVEPIQANGLADRDNPDRAQCAKADQGVPLVTVAPPLLTLQAPFARTDIAPELGAARDQTATATGGVTDPATIDLGGLVVTAQGVSSQARASCNATTTPELTGSSTVVALTVNGNVINIPTGQDVVVIDPLEPLVRIVFNEQVVTGDATSPDQALTQRAVHVELLQSAGGLPAVNVVLGESKVDRHGATCAAAPPPPVCPAGSVAQPGSGPLVCAVTVVAPCPAGSSADAAAGGACVILRDSAPVACPAGSTADPSAGGACVILRQAPPANCPATTARDPQTNNCILAVQRPCPAGSKADAQTRVCVLAVPTTGSGNGVNGSNGGVGSVTGPRVTCGKLKMHFVRNNKTSLSQRYGTRLVTRGTLVTCGSNPRPIVGARIDVVHVIGGKRQLVKTGLRSRPGGRMTLILPLNLKTRTIEFSYRPDLATRVVSSRSNLRLTVRSNRTGRVLR
ncbi:MAG TPA: choice-of-anchor P family protein [Solirubrobacteraceae bacterium]|nr:choice-of-anchor P family protein [Solirubrobacteraceae bacterium]